MNRIKEHVQAAGLSFRRIAPIMGVTQPTVSRWASGHVDIPLSQATRLALLLDVRLDDLVDWDVAMGTPS